MTPKQLKAARALEAAVIEAFETYDISNTDASKPDISLFIVSFINNTGESNPPVKDLDIRVHLMDPRLELDETGILTTPMNLGSLDIPIEQRLTFATRHIWEQVALKLLAESPPAILSGNPVEAED